MSDETTLAAWLRDRRARLDPAALGFAATRRRTPGLRREEVAQRANISATWYTWLEQGRGGAPSADVLDRLARALMLTAVEREHMFLLALGRPPEPARAAPDDVEPRLQRVLDALASPAMIKTARWDIALWNRAAAAVMTDYHRIPPGERNVLRMMFLKPETRAAQVDWLAVARGVVGVFRADTVRAGMAEAVRPFVEELSAASPEFAAIWAEQDVASFGQGIKRIRHAELGEIALEYSSFAIDGRPDLAMVVYNPATPEVAARIAAHVAASPARGSGEAELAEAA